MKKSKIIIPALGMLLLSTAASVTGTVAWFTSMQTGSAAIDSFAVTKTGGSLETQLVAGVGTELTSSSDAVVLKGKGTTTDANDDAVLTHGSYDHTQDAIWKPNDALDVFTKVNRPSAAADNYLWTVDGTSSAEGKIYYAVSWTVNFTYTYSADTRDVYLFFDAAATGGTSTFSHSKASTSDTGTYSKYTYMGFRIAMVNSGTAGAKVIWAPGTNVAADEKYQNGAAATNQGVYPGTGAGSVTTPNTFNSTGSIIDAGGYNNIKTGELPTNPTQRPDYLGTFTNTTPGTTNKIALTCVAWFEGNDQNVVDAAELDKVSASMGFYTRIKPAA